MYVVCVIAELSRVLKRSGGGLIQTNSTKPAVLYVGINYSGVFYFYFIGLRMSKLNFQEPSLEFI